MHCHCEEPEIEEEGVAGLLDDGEEGAADWEAESERDALGFEEVGDPYLDGLLVEAEGFFEYEVLVVGKGEIE